MSTLQFGKTSAGSGSSASAVTKEAVSQASPASSGRVTAAHAHVWVTGAATAVRFVIYADSSGAPGALLAVSDEVTVSQTSDAALVDFTFSGVNQINVTASTNYWIGPGWQIPSSGSVTIGRDSTASARREQTGFTYPSFPNPFGTGTTLSGPVAAYVDYSTAVIATGGTAAFGPLTGAGSGINARAGSGTANFGTVTGSGTGLRTRGGVGTAAFAFNPTGTGRRTTFGTGTAALPFTGSGTGNRLTFGTGQALLGFAATGDGYVPSFDVIPAVPLPADDLFPSPVLFPYQPPPRPANPNWPVVGFEVDFSQGPPWTPSDLRQSINVPHRRLHVRGFSVQRGRQYELDQVQAGTLDLDLPDPDELLNPDNPSSPYNDATRGFEITPYRCVQVWAMWPSQPGAGNIINGNVDTSYDPTFESGTGGWTIPPGNGGGGNIGQTTAAAFLGTSALQVQQDSNGHEMGASRTFCTAPGVTYTFSCYVYALSGTQVWVRVEDALGGIYLSESSDDSEDVEVLTGGLYPSPSLTASPSLYPLAPTVRDWKRLSVTWTTVDTLEKITIFGVQPNLSSNPNFFVDATMLNFGDIAEPFQIGGPVRYRLYTGYVERFPGAYDMQGLRALRPLQAVDALAILSRTEIHQSYLDEITVDRPSIYFPLDNTAPPAGAENLGTGFGAVGRVNNVVSSGGQQNWGGDTNPDGTTAVTFTAQNPNDPPTLFPSGSFTEMAVLGGAVSLDTVNGFTVEVWAKWTSGTAQVGTLELLQVGDARGLNTSVASVGWASYNTDRLDVFYSCDGNPANFFFPARSGPAADGAWHHMAVSIAGNEMKIYLDGVYLGHVGPITSVGHLGLNTFYMEASTQYSVAQAQVSSSRFAVYPGVISAGRIKAHWDRGNGYVGEYPGARVTRLLNALWGGPASIAAGNVALAADFSYNTRTLLDVLQEIQETERGLTYVDRFGTVTFEDRHSRYQNQQALWTFGEGVDPFAPLNQNADFQAGMAGWTAYGGTAQVSPLAWHSAPQSAAFWPDGTTAYPCIESSKVAVTPGLSYSTSCWANAPGGYAGGASASINWYDTNGIYLSTASFFTPLPADEWVQLTLTATAPTGAAFGTALPTLIGVPAATVLTYFDDAQIFPAGQAIEYPYKEYATDHDPTYVFTEFDLTRPDNQNYPPIVNSDAERKYGQRIASQEVQVIRDFDLDQAGVFYTARYAEPKTRISKLTLNPAANPALWEVVLGLEISQRIRVIRRSPAFTYSAEYYIEQINHKVVAASGEWTVELQCSPVFVPQAWVLNDTAFGVLGSSTTPVY